MLGIVQRAHGFYTLSCDQWFSLVRAGSFVLEVKSLKFPPQFSWLSSLAPRGGVRRGEVG